MPKKRVVKKKKAAKLVSIKPAKETAKKGVIHISRDNSKLRTDFDDLLDIINSKGQMSFNEIAKRFKISPALAEEWTKILEQGGLAELYYPAFGRGKVTSLNYENHQNIESHKRNVSRKLKFNIIFTLIIIIIVVVLIVILR